MARKDREGARESCDEKVLERGEKRREKERRGEERRKREAVWGKSRLLLHCCNKRIKWPEEAETGATRSRDVV